MKELYVLSDSYVPSSAATNHLFAYARGMAEWGVKISIFFLHPYHNRDKYQGKIAPNVDIHYIWEDISIKNRYLRYIEAVRRFYSMMKPEVPVLVAGASSIVFILRKKKGIRLYHERTENPQRVKGLFGGLYKRTIPKLDGMFVITPSLRHLFIDDYGIPSEKIVVTNMVVDTHRFDKLEDIKAEKTISYCGTISEWKDGVSYLIKAFAIVNRKYPDYKLVLMGGFENEETKILIMSLIEKLKLSDKIDFLGLIPSNEMPIKLKSSAILALSRPRQKEKAFGFATKIGEYLLSERPVVLTDVGDASFYLQDKKDVVFSLPNDEQDFASSLIWVIEHPNEAELIGKAGAKTAKKEFNYRIEAKKIVDTVFG